MSDKSKCPACGSTAGLNIRVMQDYRVNFNRDGQLAARSRWKKGVEWEDHFLSADCWECGHPYEYAAREWAPFPVKQTSDPDSIRHFTLDQNGA